MPISVRKLSRGQVELFLSRLDPVLHENEGKIKLGIPPPEFPQYLHVVGIRPNTVQLQ